MSHSQVLAVLYNSEAYVIDSDVHTGKPDDKKDKGEHKADEKVRTKWNNVVRLKLHWLMEAYNNRVIILVLF